MSEIAKIIGQRIRNYRTQKGLSQEKLAELAGCHPTYIGQLERGEKNATLESVEKIASAINGTAIFGSQLHVILGTVAPMGSNVGKRSFHVISSFLPTSGHRKSSR